MCGIVGYIGEDNVEQTLIQNLKFLEYRGYDSAGIAVSSGKDIFVKKELGEVSNLLKNTYKNGIFSFGIGHTRWATHGSVTKENAHPQLSQNKNWAVVHNGIIENYSILKKQLIDENYSFSSETDTEIIAQLLEKNNCYNNINNFIKTINILEGSWAVACICKNSNHIYM